MKSTSVVLVHSSRLGDLLWVSVLVSVGLSAAEGGNLPFPLQGYRLLQLLFLFLMQTHLTWSTSIKLSERVYFAAPQSDRWVSFSHTHTHTHFCRTKTSTMLPDQVIYYTAGTINNERPALLFNSVTSHFLRKDQGRNEWNGTIPLGQERKLYCTEPPDPSSLIVAREGFGSTSRLISLDWSSGVPQSAWSSPCKTITLVPALHRANEPPTFSSQTNWWNNNCTD